MTSLISILIPNFNKAPYLRECLDSVLAQTYSDWECIVVDDHSIDDSWEILQEYAQKDTRFKIFIRPEKLAKGGNTCRNFGLTVSGGSYCIFLDSDDVLTDFCLKQRLETIDNFPENDFWVFKSLLFDQNPSDAVNLWNIETEESDLIRFLRMDALWQTTGPIYKKSFVESLGGFNESLAFWQDYDLHLRAIISGGKYLKLFNLPPDVYIREGDKRSLSRSTPFTSDKEILNKRIDFFKNIEVYSFQCGNKFNEKESFSRCSTLFYFIAQYWIKHGDFELFKIGCKAMSENIFFSEVSISFYIVHVALIKSTLKYPFIQIVKDGFEKIFSTQLLDYYSLDKSLLGRISYTTQASF